MLLKKFATITNQITVNMIMYLPSRFREFILIFLFFVIHPNRMFKKIRITMKTLKYIKKENPLKYNNSKKALYSFCLRGTTVEKCDIYMKTYEQQNVISHQRNIKLDIADKGPIFVCAVKNDLNRVKMQISHHEKIGIKHFVYIDNMSDDGTFEWLIEKGVDVFRVDDEFSATAKNAWIRQITDIYGYNRWYLIMDSDELFVYPGMEEYLIKKLIDFAEHEKLYGLQSFMIDMYSKADINSEYYNDLKEYDIKKENCYFDTDSYFVENSYKGTKILGGPRARVFKHHKNNLFTPLLTKNSLMYLKKEDFFGIHYSIPYFKNFNHQLISGLLHYKFLPGDNENYMQIAEKGNYADGSSEYKQYVKSLRENSPIFFYYERSQAFNSSLDLLKINIIDKEYANKLINHLKNHSM